MSKSQFRADRLSPTFEVHYILIQTICSLGQIGAKTFCSLGQIGAKTIGSLGQKWSMSTLLSADLDVGHRRFLWSFSWLFWFDLKSVNFFSSSHILAESNRLLPKLNLNLKELNFQFQKIISNFNWNGFFKCKSSFLRINKQMKNEWKL